MNRAHHSWQIRTLGRRMDFLVFGRAGARVIAFPTSMGRFQIDAESWYNERAHQSERALRHAAYDQYIEHELLPFSATLNSNPFVIITVCEFWRLSCARLIPRSPN